jgi:GNAT superfamily N-acetyltransferase
MTVIRQANQTDIFDLLVLARGFSREAPAMHKWDKDKTEALLKAVIDTPNCVTYIWEEDGEVVGGLLGTLQPLFMSHTLVAAELAWFVDESVRGKSGALRLVKAFEGWAKDQGADYITMADIEGIANLGKLYNRLGYEKTETSYSKRIK